jgi:hypothetical protein
VVNIWNVHLQDGGAPAIRLSQIRELESHVHGAHDDQIADLVGGDFNCTPASSFCRELQTEIGPSVEQLAGVAPFATWDGLSVEPGAGQTLDYIFVRGRTAFQGLEVPHLVFAAASPAQRLSDHFGIEAVVNLTGEGSGPGAAGMLVQGPPPPGPHAPPRVLAARSILALRPVQSDLSVDGRDGQGFQPEGDVEHP